MFPKNRLSIAALLTLGFALSPLAGAQEVATAVDTGAVPVPVGTMDAQFIAKSVSVRSPATLVIHYFAECQVERGHVEYDITVTRNGIATTTLTTPPTNDTMSALCSNDGDTTESNLRAKSVGTTVACSVTSAGSYNVRVRGHVEAPSMAGPGWVDDQSLVITQHGYSADAPPCTFELPVGSGG